MTTAQQAFRRVLGQELRVDIRHSGTNGAAAGTPLLLLSGIGIGYEVFDRFVAAMDPGIEIIRVDVPGVGGGGPGPLAR